MDQAFAGVMNVSRPSKVLGLVFNFSEVPLISHKNLKILWLMVNTGGYLMPVRLFLKISW